MAKSKQSFLDSLTFLLPVHLIRAKHFSRRDVKNIKEDLVKSFSYVYLATAIIMTILATGVSVYLSITAKKSGSTYIETYGVMSLIGQIELVSCSLITIAILVVAKLIKSHKVAVILSRIAGDLLYLSAACFMLFCIFADAEKGFTTQNEALSASIIFVAVLVVIQPMYWIDAAILDLGTTVGLISVAAYCTKVFGMKAIYYYVLIAIVYPLACYLIVALLFYAESSKYKEILENERLHNNAYYDHLTHCKNRYALEEFLKENKTRWENRENLNLLIALFDIDDFKLYNDQYSHLGGDYCLKSICDAIRQEFPSPSLDFFRYGGEEFLLFFELRNPEDAPHVLEKVRKAISKLDIVAPNGAPKKMVTISLGGLLIKEIDIFNFEEEMKIVDAYLYKAKRSGKDVACYNNTIIN